VDYDSIGTRRGDDLSCMDKYVATYFRVGNGFLLYQANISG
jgi:hypothetical protein